MGIIIPKGVYTMKKLLSKSLLLSFLLILILSPFQTQARENIPFNKATCNLKMAERQLWMQHVAWTRSFITSDIASLGDKEAVLTRLLKNQDDIGNSIKPYYGEEAGNKLAALLREHIQLAGQVLDAAKSGNQDNFKKYNDLWYKNADQIADFLSSANPNYSNEALKDMLHKHLQFLTEQVTARLNNNWEADIAAYDAGEDHMIMFADMLTDGIIKQFPKMFK